MRTKRAHLQLALTIASSLALTGPAHALTVCRTPDGATYASDNPPPDCGPIPSSEIDRFPPYSEQAEQPSAAHAPPPRIVEEPPSRAIEEPPPVAAEPRPRSEETPESYRTHAIASCEQSVAEQLERPSSARWPSRGDYKVKENGGRYTVSGYVDAEGALGATKVKWSCESVFTGDRWVAVAELKPQEEAPPAMAEGMAAFPPARSSARSAESVRETTAEPPPPQEVPAWLASRPAPAPPPPPAAPVAEARVAPPPVAPPPVSAPAESFPANPPVVASAASAPAEMPPAVERWKERSSCPGIKFDASTQKFKDQGYQVVSGEITYTGQRPVRDVRVCASGVCELVGSATAPMSPGTSQKFSLKAPTLETPVVTAQCSVMVDGPGL